MYNRQTIFHRTVALKKLLDTLSGEVVKNMTTRKYYSSKMWIFFVCFFLLSNHVLYLPFKALGTMTGFFLTLDIDMLSQFFSKSCMTSVFNLILALS